MSRRLLPTLADYVVIAMNPALIMGLIGSLVYFLLEVLYAGRYPDRLQFALSAFVFASVLVSRIAIERSAIAMRSPALKSMSSSRRSGLGEIFLARLRRSSVVSPIADTTPTTSWPAARVRITRSAT